LFITSFDEVFIVFGEDILRGFMKNSLLIILIVYCCLNAFGQVVKDSDTNKGKTQLPQTVKPTTSNNTVPVSDEEYRVYATVLGKEKGMLVIGDTTNMDEDSKNIKRLEARGFEPFLKQIKPETMTDFLAKNDESKPLVKKFSTDIDYTFISTEELKENFAYKFDGDMNWETFREKYPKAGNLYTLSRVGFGHDGGQALVFVTNWCRSLCGEGNYYLLEKENCEWKIVNKVMTWIS
jgi:hypothetical protein